MATLIRAQDESKTGGDDEAVQPAANAIDFYDEVEEAQDDAPPGM